MVMQLRPHRYPHYVMALNQRSVNLNSTLHVYACWALSLHNVISLCNAAGSKYSHLEVGTAKYDLEFGRTSLKCMEIAGSGDGAGILQCQLSY